MIKDIINECGRITESKGFDTSQHLTQTMLIATEVAEAVAETKGASSPLMQRLKTRLLLWAEELEEARAKGLVNEDLTLIDDMAAYLEEHADIVIRVFSYIGANGWTDEFVHAIESKMERNRNRPMKHGKGF